MKRGEYAIVSPLPKCSFCDRDARFDGRLIGRTSWAYMCLIHFVEYGCGLGIGVGQKLYVSKQEQEDCQNVNDTESV